MARTQRCPHCDRELDQTRYGLELFALRFSPGQQAVLKALVRAKGETVHTSRLLVLSNAKSKAVLSGHVHVINRGIIHTDYWVEVDFQSGYRLRRKEPPRDRSADTWTPRDIVREVA